MDVASTMEVNHVKSVCYVIVYVIALYLVDICLQLNVCMCYSVHSIIGG